MGPHVSQRSKVAKAVFDYRLLQLTYHYNWTTGFTTGLDYLLCDYWTSVGNYYHNYWPTITAGLLD